MISINHLIFDGDTDSTLTVANFNTDTDIGSDATNVNYWCAAIGANDSEDHVKGIVINGGNIYAGTTRKDDCTAIGGGGNGYGMITINGGTVTAVSSSSGAAIGGGIGKSSSGGSAFVTINGGLVYAYNFSSPITSGSSTYTAYTSKVFAIPAAAIGGGSSGKSAGNAFTKVVITGGEVHAQTVGGTAIGGGSSGDIKGGDAIITISGGTVYAKSISGEVTDKNGKKYTLEAGASIGGGTGGYANGSLTGGADGKGGQGGSATVTITGGTVYTGSIGGGTTNNPVGRAGFANVRIDGGTVYGQVIMGEVGDGKTKCVFNMTGGTLTNTQNIVPAGHEIYSAADYNYKYPNGGAVYMDDPIGEATVDNGTISDCSAVLGGAVYMTAGTFTMNGGTISGSTAQNGGAVYMTAGEFTMTGGSISGNATAQSGGAVYMTAGKFTMTGGSISGNTAAQNGGAVYMTAGEFTMSGGSISGNTAAQNGGAIYIGKTESLSGLFTMTGGLITGNTTTVNGGGIYLDGGNAFVKGDNSGVGGLITGNSATNGGGAYLNAGNLTLSEYGAINGNTASTDGGGGYLNAGNLKILDNASISNNTAAQRGGGAFVNNGNIVMNGGHVDNNLAQNGNGGGMYVSAVSIPVYVDVYSGSVSNNRAPIGTGGAFAVVGDETNLQKIDVNIGVNENHFSSSGTPQYGFTHDCDHETGVEYTHNSCPIVSNNYSGETGGAVYISGTTAADVATALNIYCVTAKNNSSANHLSDFMRVDGGKVLISSASDNSGAGSNDHISNENDYFHGNAVITDSLHVVKGQVDVFGNMDNPSFDNSADEPDAPPNSITVDVPESGTDYFADHRYANPNSNYKILYYANYDDGNVASIKYTSYQFKIDGTHTIMPALYTRSGYEITGWNTEKDGSGATYYVNTKWTVNDELPGADTANNELILYAQWKINGYTVRYERNTPDSSLPYGGEMGDPQTFTYNVEQNLKANTYWVQGYRFTGWNTRANGTGQSFTDEQLITTNLCETNGDEIPLYAQWVECDHETDCTFIYRAENSSLESKIYKDCECRAHTEQVAVLRAQNGTYTGSEQLAVAEPAMEISYAVKESGTGTFNALAGVPVNAGTYKASVTVGGTTAEVEYTIGKATQTAPTRVEYAVTNGELAVSAAPATGAEGAEPLFKLVYNTLDGTVVMDWQKDHTFTLPVAYTSYQVMAKFEENANYLESGVTAAKEVYFYGSEDSQTEIHVDAAEGIICTGMEDKEQNGFRLDVAAESDYYLTGEFEIRYEVVVSGGANTLVMTPASSADVHSYLFTSIPPKSIITITVSGAKKAAVISAEVQEGEVFGSVEHDASTRISPDSAFTARYKITDFDASAYQNLNLRFSDAESAPVFVPAGTSIIMKDLSAATENYWYYVFGEAGSEVPITSFRNMESGEGFLLNAESYTLQFIIDFSGSAGVDKELLNTALVAVKQAGSKAPETTADVSVGLGGTAFSLTANEETIDLNTLLTCHYSGDGSASKWRGRAAAIVLTRSGSEQLPADAVLVVEIDGEKVNYRPDSNGNFTVPVGVLTSSVDVDLTLQSAMFPAVNTRYAYIAELYVSNSLVASAPMNGVLGSRLDTVVVFVPIRGTTPSLAVTSRKSVVEIKEDASIRLEVAMESMGDCTVRASVQQQTGNGYIDGAHYFENVKPGPLEIELGGYAAMPGSYRVLFTVSNGVKTIMEVPYYFIIQS